MTEQTPHEKGDRLQNVVMLIEQTILYTSPGLKEKNFTIEGKKIINSDGVHHEIDIYVTVDSAPGYSAVYIFECKNWKDSVGKNEIIAFVEKINCSNAVHGYFIGTSFTKDAMAQAEKCSRLTLLNATETDLGAVDENVMVFQTWENVQVMMHRRGMTDGGNCDSFDASTVTALFKGKPFPFRNSMIRTAKHLLDDVSKSWPPLNFGENRFECSVTLLFPIGELIVDGQDIKAVTLTVPYMYTKTLPTIRWEFDVDKRGRVLHIEAIAPGGDRHVAEMVFLNHAAPLRPKE